MANASRYAPPNHIMTNSVKQNWIRYCTDELAALTPILAMHGFSLDDDQPHLKGERFLQQAITTSSGKKLILYGQTAAGTRVVIKATRNHAGKHELKHERLCRSLLAKIDFAAEVFHTPPEVAWLEEQDFVISIQQFIEQDRTFLERPLAEQFDLALTAFKAQEGAHATTFKHRRLIRGVYEFRDAKKYLRNFSDFVVHVRTLLPDQTSLHTRLADTYTVLRAHRRTIEQYSGFLTHTDFVPHNLRMHGDTMYLLDHSSLAFGNKYEGWARFLNFMTLYNPALTDALTKYVRDNRTPEESEALWLMRLYRLGEIIFYYAKTVHQSEGDLQALNHARIEFWGTVLQYLLKHEAVPGSVIRDYQNLRDRLRSNDEKERQRGLH